MNRNRRFTMQKTMTAIFLALATVGALALVPAAPAQAQQLTVSVSLFHQQLAPHGRWFRHPRFGWAWFPTSVDAQWRPYTHGQWVWTEEHGWYWNSDEPFGWATYHYGRWGYDEVYGWVWIPGSTWGPAWVAFRYSEGHVGWAPLPPETLEFSFGFDARYTEMSAHYYEPRWVFVPRTRFLDARVYTLVAPQSQNNVYIRQTSNVTNYVTVNNVIVNRSIDRQRMETAIGRRIAAARVKDVDDARKSGRRSENAVDAYRPQVRVTREAAPPAEARAKPGDKPRYTVHKDNTPPSERRSATPAQPAKPPAAQPDAPDEKRRATPVEPAKPPAARPDAPDEKRRATPAQPAKPPAAQPDAPDEKRRATPVQPAKPPAARPGAPDEKRRATPAQPPGKAVPSAPPSQARPEPPKRSAPPAKRDEPPQTGNEDERKTDERPRR
jgi:hypothetical protein